jgi:predicted ATP-binding protein involved in virulence
MNAGERNMQSLNIQKLRLRDYRCFESLDIDFHPHLTVIVASNGAGKTSILDAIAVAFGPYVGAFDEAVGKHFEASDIRMARTRASHTNEMEYAARGVRLEAVGCVPGHSRELDDDSPATWRRALAGPTKTKTTIKDAKELSDYGKRMQGNARTAGADVLLPLIAYYGTGRLWQQKKLTESKLPRTSRTIGYTDCLDPASSYKAFAAWFHYWNFNLKDLQFSKKGDSPAAREFAGYIQSVTQAVDACLSPAGWKGLSYSFTLKTLVATHDVHGELPVELLSDGIRNMIGLVADIAFRATKLNGQLGSEAAQRTPGIVLIDEVDMHLHPAWQQTVLASLLSAFPGMQFIVTTHSPQVLSTVPRECVRVLGTDSAGNEVAEMPLSNPYGQSSNLAMHRVMKVDPQPPIPERDKLRELTRLVDQGEYSGPVVERLMEDLVILLGEHHEQIQRLRRSIQRQRLLAGDNE